MNYIYSKTHVFFIILFQINRCITKKKKKNLMTISNDGPFCHCNSLKIVVTIIRTAVPRWLEHNTTPKVKSSVWSDILFFPLSLHAKCLFLTAKLVFQSFLHYFAQSWTHFSNLFEPVLWVPFFFPKLVSFCMSIFV